MANKINFFFASSLQAIVPSLRAIAPSLRAIVPSLWAIVLSLWAIVPSLRASAKQSSTISRPKCELDCFAGARNDEAGSRSDENFRQSGSRIGQQFLVKLLISLFLFFYGPIVLAVAIDHYSFSQESQRQQFQHLITELRCLVCQNENLADSNADLAKDLRQQVYAMVIAGKDDASIKSYLVQRYGNFILFKPPVMTQTLILWVTPFILLIVGFTILGRIIYMRNKAC